MPKISVIIPALDEEKYIKDSLEGFKSQSFKDFELIVVDGGSKDRTVEIAKRYGKVIVEKKRGIARARNKGASIAKGEILVFTDADTKPTRNLIKAWNDTFKDKSIVAATGPILPLEKVSNSVMIGYKIVSIIFVKFSIALGLPSIVGSNFAVRKVTFRKVGGFDSRLITYEDWDLSERLKKKGKIAYVDKAMVYTSARRVFAWGIVGYFSYHAGNTLRYWLFKKPKTEYAKIR